jgi:hypothetical protein
MVMVTVFFSQDRILPFADISKMFPGITKLGITFVGEATKIVEH